MRRLGAKWVRIGTRLIWCVPNEEPGDTAHVDTSSVIRLIGCELSAILPPRRKAPRFRPVTSSYGWALPKKEKRYELLNWVTLETTLPLTSFLDALGIRHLVRRTPGNTFHVVFCCKNQHESDTVAFFLDTLTEVRCPT